MNIEKVLTAFWFFCNASPDDTDDERNKILELGKVRIDDFMAQWED